MIPKKMRPTGQDISIANVMTKRIIHVKKTQNVLEAARKMQRNHVGSVLVLDKGRLEGILTEHDVIKAVTAGKNLRSEPVSKNMTSKVFTAHPDSQISKVLNQMQSKRIQHIPVVDKKGLSVGIVSIRDLMDRTQKEMKRLIKVRDRHLNTDALTGLKSYRFFNDYLDIEITKSLYHGGCFSLLFMDLDNFKQINDSEGHSIGNLVLMRLGEVLNQRHDSEHIFSLRKSDVAVRFGGDEFGIILPDTDAEGAVVCAERLLKMIRTELNSITGISPTVPLTVSIGIATYPADAKDRQTLINHADAALYTAKGNGKNQICVYGTMTPEAKAARSSASSKKNQI